MDRQSSFMDELTNYIKKNLKKGYTKESLRWALIEQGYSKIEVERALKKVDESLASEAPILHTKPKIKYEAYPIDEKRETKKVKIKTIKEKSSFWRDLLGI